MKYFTRTLQISLIIGSVAACVLLSRFVTSWKSVYYDHSNALTLGRILVTPNEVPLALLLLFFFSFLLVFLVLVPGRYTDRYWFLPIPLRFVGAIDLVWYPFALIAFISAYISIVNSSYEERYYRAADNLVFHETEMATLQASILSDCSYLAGVEAKREHVVANNGEVELWKFCGYLRDSGVYRAVRGPANLESKWERGVLDTCSSSGVDALRNGARLTFKAIDNKVNHYLLAALAIKISVLCQDVVQVGKLKKSESFWRGGVNDRSLFNGWIALFLCIGASLKVVNAVFRIWPPIRL
jgi:hypothetical protein